MVKDIETWCRYRPGYIKYYQKRITIIMHDCYFESTDSGLVNLFEKSPVEKTKQNKLK